MKVERELKESVLSVYLDDDDDDDTKRDRRSNKDSQLKHQSENTFSGWRQRLLRHCSRSTARGHTSPIPFHHLSRLRA